MSKAPESKLPSFWQLQTLGWVGFYLLIIAVSIPYLNQKNLFRDNTWFVVSLFLDSCLLRPICRSLDRRTLGWIGLELRTLAWCAFLGTVTPLLVDLVGSGLRHVDWADWLLNSLQYLVVLTLWCNLYLGTKQWLRSAQERERLARAEAEAREARLSALRYQLNPHFLFNSLNAVSALVLDGNAPAATRMLSQIGEFLRTTLSTEITAETALSREIALAEQYLAIEQTRLGDRLKVDVAISPDTLDALVPDMLLQPLLENAVQHGIAPLVDGGVIAINSSRNNGRLRIVVTNSAAQGEGLAVGNSTPRNGIGLTNTAQRLKMLYGPDHKFALEWPQAGACQVVLELPFKKA
jgi:two-component system LytT family sensor kinase